VTKRLTSLIVILLVTALILGAAGCGTQAESPGEGEEPSGEPSSPDKVKIGVWEPLTGALAGGGAQKLEGYKLANQLRPNVLGAPVELVIVDNKSDKVEAANSMSRLIEQENVVAVLGCYGSSLAIAGIAVSDKAGVPVLPCGSSPLVTQGKKYVTRVNYLDPFAGVVMARYAFRELGAETAAIIQDVAQDYSVGLAQFFRKAFIELTGDPNSVTALVSYQTGDQDFTAQLTHVASKDPDVIFCPGYYADAALMAKQAREMDIDIPLLGGDAWEAPELIEIGGEFVEGLTFCSHFHPDAANTPKAQDFVQAYEDEYGRVTNTYSAIAFDAYNLLLDSIEKVGELDREKINHELRHTVGWEGVTGTVTIDPETGNPDKPAIILQVRDGEFAYVTTVNP